MRIFMSKRRLWGPCFCKPLTFSGLVYYMHAPALVLKQYMSYGPISFDAVSVYDVYLRAGSFESSCDLHSCLLIAQFYPAGDMQKTQP